MEPVQVNRDTCALCSPPRCPYALREQPAHPSTILGPPVHNSRSTRPQFSVHPSTRTPEPAGCWQSPEIAETLRCGIRAWRRFPVAAGGACPEPGQAGRRPPDGRHPGVSRARHRHRPRTDLGERRRPRRCRWIPRLVDFSAQISTERRIQRDTARRQSTSGTRSSSSAQVGAGLPRAPFPDFDPPPLGTCGRLGQELWTGERSGRVRRYP
jgi:hypothetical protein